MGELNNVIEAITWKISTLKITDWSSKTLPSKYSRILTERVPIKLVSRVAISICFAAFGWQENQLLHLLSDV